MAVLFGLGFSSGLPLLIAGSLLRAVITDAGFNIKTITALASVALPYTLKFLWAPLLDRYRLPFLGRRRGWILVLQIALAIAIAVLGGIDPRSALSTVVVLAVIVTTLSATQDIVLDAYAAEILSASQRASGSATYTMGYRVAVLITGTVALGLGDKLQWWGIYAGLAVLMALCTIATLFAEEPPEIHAAPPTLVSAVVKPLAELFRRDGVLLMLAFIALYKFADYFYGVVAQPFYRIELGFKWSEIATLSKALGFVGTLIGASAAGVLVPKLGMRRALFIFGVAQCLTILGFFALAVHGKSYPMLGGVIFVDNVASAMGTGAFAAFLMSQTKSGFSATQFAVFTGLSSVGSHVFGFLAGDVANSLGYPGFFAVSAALAIPGLLLIRWLPVADVDPVR